MAVERGARACHLCKAQRRPAIRVERRQGRTQVNRTVPSLIRLLAAIAVLVALVYGGAYWLATKVEPVTRDVTITVPNDRFQK